MQPVRPQNRVFRLFGVLMVTLWPGRSIQPVAASGVLGLGAAATQIVCDISLTKVTRRRGALATTEGCEPAPPAEDDSESASPEAELGADAVVEDAIGDAAPESGSGASDAGAPVIRTTAGAAAATGALFARWVALGPPTGAAQPAAAATATSTAAAPAALAISALVDRPGRRLPFPPNITGILPALVCSRVGDGGGTRR